MTFDPKAAAEAVMEDVPSIDVTNAAEAADWLRGELGKGELSGIFLREDMLVHTPRIGEDGYIDPAKLGLKDAGPAQVRPIATPEIKALIETRYNITRWQGPKDEKEQVHCLFPVNAANSACDAARIGEHIPHLRLLQGVTHTPTIRPDGTLLDQPGYDDETLLLYLPEPGLEVPVVPDNPTRAEIDAAREFILQPVRQFPFVTEDDRATWVGLAFTPPLRPLLPPPYQMGVITATNPGTGKTLLANMLMTLHGGVQRGEMPRDDAELRKAITATLVTTTAPIVLFDNLAGVVKSPVLDGLLTARTWTDRFLGQTKEVTAPNDRLWLATGNNAQFGGDLARRTQMVSLDPPAANHHLRTDFDIKNLGGWMEDHRGEYLGAILIIARGWVNAGSPRTEERSDSYAGWISGLRALMKWARFKGTFGGTENAAAISSEDEEWRDFLIAIHNVLGGASWLTKTLVDSIGSGNTNGWPAGIQVQASIDPASLPGDLSEKWSQAERGYTKTDAAFRRSLGKWLQFRHGRYAGGWKLVRAGRDSHVDKPLYAVEPPSGWAKP
jgi:hypothetical protein